MPTLSIHLATSNGTRVLVRRDGVVLGAPSLDTALPVDPAEQTVIVDAAGTQSAVFTSRIGEGEHAAEQEEHGQ